MPGRRLAGWLDLSGDGAVIAAYGRGVGAPALTAGVREVGSGGPGVSECDPAAGQHPDTGRRSRRWRRRAPAGFASVALAVTAAIALTWATTPGVGDAEARVRAVAAGHGATDAGGAAAAKLAASVVAVEDSRFYRDHGVDLLGAGRFALSAVRRGDQGGSTIDQQLARLIYPSGSGVAAKVAAVVVGVKLDGRYPKATILEMYLAVAYLGHGFYGVDAASRGYFGVAPSALSWGQAALLAGLLAAPSAYDPLTHPDLARQRQLIVLRRLVATHQLDATQADTAAAAGLALADTGR